MSGNDYLDLHHIIRRVVHSFLTGEDRPHRAVLALPPSSRHPSAAERRVQVARCRALRLEIAGFEADFKRAHGTDRLPRSSMERFPVAHVYDEYRGLKQAIRDDAARHIQAVFRGHRVRSGASGAQAGGAAAAAAAAAMAARRMRASSSGSVSAPAAAGAAAAAAAAAEGRPSVAVGALPTPAAVHLANLRDEKASLKRQLRAFDTEFAERNGGRQPSKADKEHLRPLYTRYHALKTLISESEGASGGVAARSPPSGDKGSGAAAAALGATAAAAAAGSAGAGRGSAGGSAATGSSSSSSSSSSSALSSSVARRLSLGSDGGVSTVSDGAAGAGGDSGKEEEDLASGVGDLGATAHGAATGAVDPALLAEKRALQATLRVFEKEFEAKHGRKVKFVKDIESVKDKYARYKVLKSLGGDKQAKQ